MLNLLKSKKIYNYQIDLHQIVFKYIKFIRLCL